MIRGSFLHSTMIHSSKAILLMTVAASLSLTSCSGARTHGRAVATQPVHAPVNLQPVDATSMPPEALPVSGDTTQRIAMLEGEVSRLKQEVVAARPKIAKIDVMEQKFKDLSLGLDHIDATYGMAATARIAAEAAPAPKAVAKAKAEQSKKQVEKAQPAYKGGKTVHDLRIGEQKGFTRLVLDLGQPVKVTYDIDNAEKIMLIEIPGFTWSAAAEKTLSSSPLIASYQVKSDAAGSHLAVQLKKATKVANYSQIGATGDKPPRAVIDIAAQ